MFFPLEEGNLSCVTVQQEIEESQNTQGIRPFLVLARSVQGDLKY